MDVAEEVHFGTLGKCGKRRPGEGEVHGRTRTMGDSMHELKLDGMKNSICCCLLLDYS